MKKLYNIRKSIDLPAASNGAGRPQAERRNTKNVSQKYNSSTKIFFRYREPAFGIKEKEDKGIRGIQFLPTDFQKDKRARLCCIIFRKRKPAKLSGKHNGIGDYPFL
jgi:hypothetical protein